ncbi:MAG: deoxyribonuclease IV [Candidatus Bathyarchaeota archaeon]
MRFGFHISIQGSIDLSVDRAEELGCNTFQIFTRSPRQWNSSKIVPETARVFREKMKNRDIKPVFAHMPYLPNLASPRNEIYAKSIKTLSLELERCRLLNIPYLVTHLGSHLGVGKQEGFSKLIGGIDEALSTSEKQVTLLLENTAGTKNSMGSTFEDLNHIIESLEHSEMVGICFDTSHAFAAGYDLRSEENIEDVIEKIDKLIGFERLKIVHLNDSRGELNSHIDRHEHIGLGNIGEEGFRNLFTSKFNKIPMIMETPKDSRRDDIGNMKKVKELAIGL